MQAQVLYGINDLRLEERPLPVPGPGEALVRVRAAGICGSDVPRILLTGAHVHPLIPGHEFMGELVSLPEEYSGVFPSPKGLRVGQRVGIFPLIPCGHCGPCREKKYELCRSYSYLGSRRDGGFAEYCSVPLGNLLPLPDEVTDDQAAMLEPMDVALHAIRRVHPEKEETVLVIGLGTIGLFVTMFLKGMGVGKVLCLGKKDFQKDRVLHLGVPEEDYCDIRVTDPSAWVREREADGPSCVIECVGREETIREAVDLAAPSGRIVLVGNPASDISFPKDIYWKILRNQLRVTGSWNSSYTGESSDDWHYVLKALREGRVHPEAMVTHRLPLSGLYQGVRIMKDHTEDYAKILVYPGR